MNTDELEVAFGKETLANPQYGQGGKPQFFVKDIESEISKGTLSRGESYDLHNYKISSDDYFNMTKQKQNMQK